MLTTPHEGSLTPDAIVDMFRIETADSPQPRMRSIFTRLFLTRGSCHDRETTQGKPGFKACSLPLVSGGKCVSYTSARFSFSSASTPASSW